MRKRLAMPTIFKAALLTSVLIFGSLSCSRNYLDVTEPSAISPEIFPTKVEDLDLMLIDLYGRLRNGYYFTDIFSKAGIGLDHTGDQGYNGAGFNEWFQNNLLPINEIVGNLWERQYEGVSRSNAFLGALNKLKSEGVNADQEAKLNVLEGQGRFIRAFNYFFLVQFFGESPLNTEADRSKLGVPLWDTIASSIASANRERATIGQIWDFIVADLERAEILMANQTSWDDANKARADLWSVKAFLAKAYLFSLKYDKARDKAKEVIEQSGKTLMPYDTYRNAFNGDNQFNSESLFELNFTPDNKDVWNTTLNTSSQYGIIISPSYVEDNGNEGTNGFGNLFIHDKNIRRFGFKLEATTSDEQKNPAYIAQSLAVRQNKEADPRLYVGTLQPYVDSVQIDNVWRKVGKNRGEGFDLTQSKAWCHRKFVVLSRSVWADPGPSIAANMYFLRLADIYLIYAEASAMTGDNTTALEFVNKVKRRAYGFPIDQPSAVDYASMTAPTVADPADPLANDPLKYERWAELFAEGQWWFDVRRWKIGAQEASWYGSVKSGQLVWSDFKYAFPIPQVEMNNNNLIQKQNDGY